MAPPRKIDRIPAEVRDWLQEELKARGFGGYVELSAALNDRLEKHGLDMTIGKSALHEYGSEFREYAKLEERAQDEMKAFLKEMSATDEVDVTSALFQQLSTIAFRTQMAIAKAEGGAVDPRGLKDLTTALNNLIRSTDLREKIAAEEAKKAGAKLDAGVAAGDIDAAAAQKARELLGFA